MAAGPLLPSKSYTSFSFRAAPIWNLTAKGILGHIIPSLMDWTIDSSSTTPCDWAPLNCLLVSEHPEQFHLNVFAVYMRFPLPDVPLLPFLVNLCSFLKTKLECYLLEIFTTSQAVAFSSLFYSSPQPLHLAISTTFPFHFLLNSLSS